MRHFSQVSRFDDEMAKTAQALDDLTDIEEDLKKGEFNYASAYVLRSRRKGMPDKKHALEAISHAMLAGDVVPRFFQELVLHARVLVVADQLGSTRCSDGTCPSHTA